MISWMKWRVIVNSLEELGGEVLILSNKSGDSLSESDSIMTDMTAPRHLCNSYLRRQPSISSWHSNKMFVKLIAL